MVRHTFQRLLLASAALLLLASIPVKAAESCPALLDFNRDFPIELNFYWKPLENHHDFIEV